MSSSIGILTYHRAANYGAVLQAYALQTAFSKLGRDTEIIDYYCPAVEEDHRPFGRLGKRGNVIQILTHSPVKIRKDKVFGAFRQRKFKMSEPMKKGIEAGIADRYDLFVAGSDQVWNDRLSGMDPAYMMDFARPEQRYSYACSFGFDKFPAGREETYIERLKGIRCISLRETSGVQMLEKAGIPARVDLDPTLLLTAKEWGPFSEKPRVTEPYILVYTVNGAVHLLEFARKLSEETGYPILYLNNQYKTNRDLTRIRYAAPEEFVGWFSNAEYVLTNSFHGTVFSILFHRKFKIELETAKSFNVRSRDLLASCGLDDCVLKNGPEDFTFRQDFEEPDRLLEKMRDRSFSYLKSICESAENIRKA